MPSATTNGVRRSGTVNSSRGRPPAASSVPGASSSSALEDIEASSGDYAEQSEEEGEGAGRANDLGADVRRLLHELDRNPEPLSSENADGSLRASTAAWLPINEMMSTAMGCLSDIAEHRADVLDQTEDGEDDERLGRLDTLYMQLLDVKMTAYFRKRALEELRERLRNDERITDAQQEYTLRVAELENEYQSKTKRQRYGTSKSYERYRAKVWDAMHDDSQPMPPLNELIGAEEGEEADASDDDIAVFGGQTHTYKCPISLIVMTNPLKSTVCSHAFEKEAILDLLRAATKPCPAGCNARLNKSTLIEDPEFTKACRQYARRRQRRRDNDRTQTEATLLD